MKKRILAMIMILTVMAVLMISVQSHAAGACVLTQSGTHPGAERMWRQYTCTADAADGTVANYTVVGFTDYYIYSVETWPGGTAPTDASDLTLLDAVTGEDLLGANGTDAIDATTPKTIFPKSTAMGLNFYHMVKGNLTLVVTQAAVATNSAVMNIRITAVR